MPAWVAAWVRCPQRWSPCPVSRLIDGGHHPANLAATRRLTRPDLGMGDAGRERTLQPVQPDGRCVHAAALHPAEPSTRRATAPLLPAIIGDVLAIKHARPYAAVARLAMGKHAWARPAAGRPTWCRRGSLEIRSGGTERMVRCQRRPNVDTA